jgi:hypothetical protein
VIYGRIHEGGPGEAKQAMHDAHGQTPDGAVGGSIPRRYYGAMKPHHQNPDHLRNAAPRRRYPSLSDDGQPWFPRDRRPAASTLFPGNHLKISWVRTVALLAIIVLIVVLAVTS